MQIRKSQKKLQKKCFVFEIKASELLNSLLLRKYLSSAVNVLRKRLKNFHVSKSDFCKSITFTVIAQADKDALSKIESVFRPIYHVAFRDVLSNRSF